MSAEEAREGASGGGKRLLYCDRDIFRARAAMETTGGDHFSESHCLCDFDIFFSVKHYFL